MDNPKSMAMTSYTTTYSASPAQAITPPLGVMGTQRMSYREHHTLLTGFGTGNVLNSTGLWINSGTPTGATATFTLALSHDTPYAE